MYRRGQLVEDMGEEAVEYEPSDQGDVIYQLGDKIRTQAKRLSTLEQYKLLCEKRILELCPGHELPVRTEHLGAQTGDALRQQLYQAQQHIARLEQTMANSSATVGPAEWTKEKQDLEESLRREVLNSEKQRAYIETLKQALEVKMEGLGLRAPVDTFAQLSQRQESVDLNRREVERFKGVVKDQEAVIRQREGDLQEAKKTVSVLKSDLDSLRKSLQQAQDDIKKLEVEKNTLLEYVQEQQHNESSLKDTISALKTEAKAASSQAGSATEQLRDVKAALAASQARTKQLEDQVQRLLEESTKAQLSYTQVKAALEVTQSKVKDLTQQLQTHAEQHSSLQARHDALQTTHSSLATDAKALKNNSDQLRLELDSANKQRSYLQEALRSSKEQASEKEAAEYKTRSELKETQRALLNLREETASEIKSLTARLEDTKRELAATERQLEETQLTSKRRAEESASLEKSLKETHIEAVHEFETHIRDLESELKASKTEAAGRLKSAEGEVQHLTQIVRELQDALKRERVEKEQLEADYRQSQLKLALTTEDSDALSQEQTTLKSELAGTKALAAKHAQALRTLQEEHAKTAARLETADRELARQQAFTKSMSEENEGLKGNLDALQVDLESISTDVVRNAEELAKMREALAASKTKEQQSADELTQLRNYLKAKTPHLQRVSFSTEAPLLQQLIDLLSAVESLQHSSDSAQKEGEVLKASVASITSELHRVHSDLANVLKSEQGLKDQNANLKHEMDLLRTQMDQSHFHSTDHISRMTDEMADLQRENATLREELSDAREHINSAESENEAIRETVSRLQYQLQLYEEKSADTLREKRALELLLTRITNCIPSPSLKALALDMLQVKCEIFAAEKSQSQVRSRVSELESRLSSAQDPLETVKLHRVVQSQSNSLAETDSTLDSLRRRLQTLEMQMQETEEVERRKTLEGDHFERLAYDLQERLDRKAAELTQTQYSLLQTPQRSVSPYRSVSYESRTPQSASVQERLEQARSTINELKKLSRSGI